MKYNFLVIAYALTCIISTTFLGQGLDLGPDTSYCTNSSIPISSNIIDSTYSYLWSNGDTTTSIEINNTGEFWLQISYDTSWQFQADTGLVTFDSIIVLADTINISINSAPQPMFSTSPNCFGQPSLIINMSIFEPNASIIYIIGMDTISTSEDTIFFSFLQNGGDEIVFTTITQQSGCSAQDTFTLSSLLKPTILLNIDSTCENIAPAIQNLSTNITSAYSVSISESDTYSFHEMNTFILPLQSSGSHSYSCTLTNTNGCSDTMTLPLYIFDILPREIIGLEPDYCVGDPSDQIHGNFPDGDFTGPYITILPLGQALFNPIAVDSNILIIYTYTDSNTCTLSTSSIVEHIFPLPQLNLEGLEDQYCQFDPPSIISVTPPGGNLTGPELTEFSENGAVFTPNLLGPNSFEYTYTDIQGCFNSLNQTSIVNPLPNVELGPRDTLIGIGETLILGPEFTEPNVVYSWSTGQKGNTLEVSNPGYYILFGTDSITRCQSSDTIRVELLNRINNTELPVEIKIYPLPFSSELFIVGQSSGESINVFDLYGRTVPFHIVDMGDIIRLDFNLSSSQFLVLQLNRDISIPIIKSSSH